MPPFDRVWRAAEYQKAIDVLHSLRPDELPRASSPISSPILEKLTDPASYQACIDDTMPSMNELQYCKRGDACRQILQKVIAASVECVTQLETLRGVIPIYGAAVPTDRTFADDIIVLAGLLMQTGVLALDFNDRLTAAMERVFPGDPQVAASRADFIAKVSKVMQSGPAVLENPNDYSPFARARYAKLFAAGYARLAQRATPEARAHAEAALGRIAREDPNPDVRAALTAVGLGHSSADH